MTDLSGKFRTTHKQLASGRTKIYYFTKPGGTGFFSCMDAPLSQPFPAAFIQKWQEAIDTESPDKFEGECAKIIHDYLQSEKFSKKADATRQGYERDLAVARAKFGSASKKVLEDRRFKGEVIAWHEQIAKSSPRRADLCLTALRNAFDYAYRRGVLVTNPADGIEKLYERPTDKAPWTKDELALWTKDAPQWMVDTFDLARHTGLRRKDLAEITWDGWKGDHIEWRTSKSRKTRTVIVTLLPEAQDFLADMKKRQMDSSLGLQRTILTGAKGRSMRPETLRFINERATSLEIDKTLHRLRYNRCCLLIEAGWSDKNIADEMGWTLEDVADMKKIYAQRDVIVAAQVRKLRERMQ